MKSIIGRKPKRWLRTNVGQGFATYALLNGLWYSVNLDDGGRVVDERWQASTRERDQLIAILISRKRQ